MIESTKKSSEAFEKKFHFKTEVFQQFSSVGRGLEIAENIDFEVKLFFQTLLNVFS